jgi:polyisoprenoid-binding protein YceI
MTSTMTSPAPVSATGIRTTWTLDSGHSLVEFSVKHLVFSTVKGRFSDVDALLTLDESDLAASAVEVRIGAASIDTRLPPRDAHLRSADFFDVERWPHLAFRTTRIERDATGSRVTGDLTIRDVTREVVLAAREEGRGRNSEGRNVMAFTATTDIDRRDFGLTWNQALETGGVVVGNAVRIDLTLLFVKD